MMGLPGPVRAAVDAANRGDERAFLDCFTPDGVVDDWGHEYEGRPEIQRWSAREFVGVRVTLEILAVEVASNLTTVTARVGGLGFNGLSHFAFTIAGDRVARMTIRA
jgi:hypothetical protein